jgi:hypothetical protein
MLPENSFGVREASSMISQLTEKFIWRRKKRQGTTSQPAEKCKVGARSVKHDFTAYGKNSSGVARSVRARLHSLRKNAKVGARSVRARLQSCRNESK